jgi:hypothetical protein
MEYIPGYTTIKNTLTSIIPPNYFSWKGPNIYELFDSSQATSNQGFFSSASPTPSVDDPNIARWSSQQEYNKDDMVKYNGFIYTSIKDSKNKNPVREIVDTQITVEDEYWKVNGLSSKVKRFNEDTDATKTYTKNDIVIFDDILYKCKNNLCTSDFTNPQWESLSSSIITPAKAPAVKADTYYDSVINSAGSMINDFNIEEIPGEPLSDKVVRIVKILIPYVTSIALFFLAIILASLSANDLIHKPFPFRILAFYYTYFFVSTQSYIGIFIALYYFIRSVFGSYLSMKKPYIYGILPIWEDPGYNFNSRFPPLLTYPITLREYIQQMKNEFNAIRLESHGDIIGMLQTALHVPKQKSPFAQGVKSKLDAATAEAAANAAAAAKAEGAPTAPAPAPATSPTGTGLTPTGTGLTPSGTGLTPTGTGPTPGPTVAPNIYGIYEREHQMQ